MLINMYDDVGVIAAENGFIVIVKGKMYGRFPYHMKKAILSLFDVKKK